MTRCRSDTNRKWRYGPTSCLRQPPTLPLMRCPGESRDRWSLGDVCVRRFDPSVCADWIFGARRGQRPHAGRRHTGVQQQDQRGASASLPQHPGNAQGSVSMATSSSVRGLTLTLSLVSAGEKELVVLGDFGCSPQSSELDVLRKEKFCPLVPPTQFTNISTRSPQGSRCLDNIWLSRSTKKVFSGKTRVSRLSPPGRVGLIWHRACVVCPNPPAA